jgi:hypothetical protein
MALLWVEGFETYGTSGRPSPNFVMGRKYATYLNEAFDDIVTGRKGYGYSMSAGSSFLETPNISTERTWISGVAFKLPYPESSSHLITFFQTGSVGVSVYYTGTGELSVVLGPSTILDTTSGLGLTSGVWYWVEFKAYCDDSAGTYEIRLNGLNVLSSTGEDTRVDADIDYYTSARLGFGLGRVLVDDWYICDSSGSNNNDFLGDVSVETIYPDSDSAITWTPDTGGTNYTQINETVVDDTDYVEATTGKDLYGYGDLVTTNLIYGIMVNTDAELSDVTAYSLKNVVKSSAVENTVTYNTIGMGASSLLAVFEEDPNTSTLWLYGAVNAATFGVEVV